MSLLAAAAASGRAADTGAITTLHFIVIGVLIVLVLAGIVYGARLKRRRAAAEAAGEDRVEALETAEAAGPEGPESDRVADAATEVAPGAPLIAGAPGFALRDVKGLGPKAVPLLAAQGVDDLAALAALSAERAAAVDAQLGPLSGRMARDRWVEQARLLASGDRAGFEATFGKL